MRAIKHGKSVFLLIMSCFVFEIFATTNEKPIVVIIPSYNNEQWCKRNLESVFLQDYENYRVIYIDDCSSDHTYPLVQYLIQEFRQEHRVTLIHNVTRKGAMENLYNAIHPCPDDAIVATLDGDDFLAGPHVLKRINQAYQNPNVWLTYGQFMMWPGGQLGWCTPLRESMVSNNAYREETDLLVSHLRTFYAWLFKLIKREDFIFNGSFFTMAWDKAMLIPMLEMAYGKFQFIPDVLYLYNVSNPINDHKVSAQLQNYLYQIIRQKPKYKPYHRMIV